MPICKNCKKRIDRFNKDRCPICGVERPFEGMSSDTVEITTNIDTDKYNSDYHPCKKKNLLIYFLAVGFTGAPFFYIHKRQLGFFHLVANLALIAVITLVITFAAHLFWVFGLLIGLGSAYLMNIALGLYYYSRPNLKDGHGEFII